MGLNLTAHIDPSSPDDDNNETYPGVYLVPAKE